jgi:Alpha/beta hydrolase domain
MQVIVCNSPARVAIRPKSVSVSVIFAGLLASCGGGSFSFSNPGIPAAKSSIVPPELTIACPIIDSSIASLVTKGKGLAFGGASFGTVGTYTYYLSEATAKVSAKDPCAATIVDLKNAADSNGLVTYKFDVIIITPTDAAKASGTLLYEVNNRTNNPSFAALQDGNGQDLFTNVKPAITGAATGGVTTGTGAGNGFLLNQGATVVWSGWQGDRPQTLAATTAEINATTKWFAPGMSLPVALDPAKPNSKITGEVQDEFIADNDTANLLGTYYNMAPNAAANASLTIRKTALAAPITVDKSLWTYTAGSGTAEGGNTSASGYGFVTINRTGVRANTSYAAALDAGSDNGSIYHFNYTATDPKPFGLGFLGLRDLISFLRHDAKDPAGNDNPVAGRIKTTLATGISQSGRYLRDFLWQGFNTDKKYKIVFDGMLPLVGGSRKTYTNYRWAKPGDYSRQHENHYTPGDQFPFGYATLTDPVSGKTDGLLKKCTEMNTCPKVFQYDSPIEFTGARASLTVTDGGGKDMAIPGNVRMFYAPGTSHGPQQLANNAINQADYTIDRTVASTAVSLSPGALNASTALYRALLVNLEGWVKGTVATPLASNFPSVAAGTMAVPTSLPSSLGSPDLASLGLGFNGGFNTLTLNDETVIPSLPSTKAYVVHLPTSDAQGNDRGGVKMPDIATPLATFKGYSLRKSGFVAGDQNSLSSSQLAFALTTAGNKLGDPRQSVEQLYGNKAGYVSKANAAIDALVKDGYMLADDAAMYKNRVTMQSLQPNFALLP